MQLMNLTAPQNQGLVNTIAQSAPKTESSVPFSNPFEKIYGEDYSFDFTNPYKDYFDSSAISVPLASGTNNKLSEFLYNQNLGNYNSVVGAPSSISTEEFLKNHPEAKYWSDETITAAAKNYKLSQASLYNPSLAAQSLQQTSSNLRPIAELANKVDYTYKGDKYKAIIDPKKIVFDPVYGLVTQQDNITKAKENSTGLIGGIVDQFGSGPLPTLALLASAYFGLPPTGLSEASTAGAASGAGTFGAAADAALGTGMITSPSGLAGLVGAAPIGSTIPAVAGGFLNPALAGAAAGAVGSAASGGLGDFPFQSPSSISPVGETPALNNTGTGLSTVGSTPPDLGTGMITSPEGLSGLVNSPPIGTTLGAGTPGTTGGFLNPILGGAPLATTAAAGGLAQGASSVTDFLSNLFSKGADKFMENPLQNTVGILSALSSTSQGKDLADQLKALMNQGLSQSDPFGSQRAQYAAKLKQTYDNPNTYLGSEEYKGISRKRLEALERADAAQGRRSQYGARAEKMYEFDQENLMKERTMLAQLAGSGIQPGQVGNILSTLGAGSANAQVNANGQLYALLASMVKGS